MTTADEYSSLLSRSEEFLNTAEYQIGMRYFTVAAFSLHQSLELYLEAKLFSGGIVYPKSHSVRNLLELLADTLEKKCSLVAKQLLDSFLMEYALLEDAYITSRYFSREFSRGELERLHKAVKESVKDLGANC